MLCHTTSCLSGFPHLRLLQTGVKVNIALLDLGLFKNHVPRGEGYYAARDVVSSFFVCVDQCSMLAAYAVDESLIL